MVSRLLYRDGLMLVIDKPAGMAVHRGSPNSKDRNKDRSKIFRRLAFGLPRRPALAHRLDRDTSGCLVLGRHRKALAQLGQMFRNGAIDKLLAIVEGVPNADERHRITAWPARRPHRLVDENTIRMAARRH